MELTDKRAIGTPSERVGVALPWEPAIYYVLGRSCQPGSGKRLTTRSSAGKVSRPAFRMHTTVPVIDIAPFLRYTEGA